MHDHEHHDHADHGHPHSFAGAVDELAGTAAAIRDHLAADARDAADDAVHGMGHLLEDLREVVPGSGLDAAAKAEVERAIDDLFECFDKLDTALHAPPGEGAAPAEIHASLAGRIEAALQVLQKAGNPSGVTGGGHDDAADIIRAANQAEENR